jgi:hypothetical protein
MSLLQLRKTLPGPQVETLPIVHSGTTNVLLIKGESQRPHKMKPGPGGNAETGDVPGVLRNLRLDQHDMKHGERMAEGKRLES